MSTFKLYISKDASVDETLLTTLEKNHTTNQDNVVRIYVDRDIKNGFEIIKDDNLLETSLRTDNVDLDDTRIQSLIKREAKILKESAKFSKDNTVIKGAKPLKEHLGL